MPPLLALSTGAQHAVAAILEVALRLKTLRETYADGYDHRIFFCSLCVIRSNESFSIYLYPQHRQHT
jgi:hypothetical protein